MKAILDEQELRNYELLKSQDTQRMEAMIDQCKTLVENAQSINGRRLIPLKTVRLILAQMEILKENLE